MRTYRVAALALFGVLLFACLFASVTTAAQEPGVGVMQSDDADAGVDLARVAITRQSFTDEILERTDHKLVQYQLLSVDASVAQCAVTMVTDKAIPNGLALQNTAFLYRDNVGVVANPMVHLTQ